MCLTCLNFVIGVTVYVLTINAITMYEILLFKIFILTLSEENSGILLLHVPCSVRPSICPSVCQVLLSQTYIISY